MLNEMKETFNIILGIISLLALISGFLIEEYRLYFWISGAVLLIFVIIGYYVADNRSKIDTLNNKFKKIEESLNIYDRLNKIELRLKK